MAFDALEVALQLLDTLAPVVAKLRLVDRDAADQLRRAASSVAYNVAEGRGREGADAKRVWRIARGELEETRVVLRAALALRSLTQADVAPALALADREAAMLYRLAR